MIESSSRSPVRVPWLVAAASATAAGAATGAVLTYLPLAGLAAAAAVIGGLLSMTMVRFRSVLPAAFLSALAVVLAGYALFGRSFAYLGVPPLFIGEMMLAFAIGATLSSRTLPAVLRSPVIWLILLLAVLGLARTVPYVGRYGIDALRDATIWGYGAFAIAVAACVIRTNAMPVLADKYSGWLTLLAAWLPIALTITKFLGDWVPKMPGTDVSLIGIKPGDAGVHLAGGAIFVLLGLYSDPDHVGAGRRSPRLFWASWLTSLLFVAALNRGGFLSIVLSLGLVAALEPKAVGRRLTVALVGLALVTSIALPVSLSLEDTSQVAASSEERALTPSQVVENILSILGRQSEARGNLGGTREWRMEWWTTIVNYTVNGPLFWSGRGFGANLADEDGFQVAREDEAPLRSPHNIHMTVLARMGVPGIAMWVAIEIAFILLMIGGSIRARMAGATWWSRVHIWVLGYWCAFLINASFDVYLEGPQGGIWFWSMTGLGIGVATSCRLDLFAARRARVAA